MAVIATDNFNRANGSLGTNWTTGTSADPFAIVSNQAVTGDGDSVSLWTANDFPDDQYAQVTLVSMHADGLGVALRGSISARTWYWVMATGTGGGSVIYCFISGSVTQVYSGSTSWAASDVLYASIVGTLITVKKNGVTAFTHDTAGDASRIAAGRPGLAFSSPGFGF